MSSKEERKRRQEIADMIIIPNEVPTLGQIRYRFKVALRSFFLHKGYRYFLPRLLRKAKRRMMKGRVPWSRDDVVALMLEYINTQIEDQKKTTAEFDWSSEEGIALENEVTALLQEHHGPQWEEEAENQSKKERKGILVEDKSGMLRRHVWLLDDEGLYEAGIDEYKEGTLEYWDDFDDHYWFRISDDLIGVDYSFGGHPLGLTGYSLLVVKSKGKLKIVDDPDGGFWIS